MNDTLKLLYDRFYTLLFLKKIEREIDDYYWQLIEWLENQRENWLYASWAPKI